MSNFLFEEFQTVSSKEWKQKIQVDLKGADYNKTLLTKTNEGITIKPFSSISIDPLKMSLSGLCPIAIKTPSN